MNIIVCLQQTQQYYLRRSREDIIQNIESHVRFHIKLLWHIKNSQLILANSPRMYITKLVHPVQLIAVKYVQIHNQELLNMIHGRQPEVNGEISLSNMLAHLQQGEQRKNVSFILKNLIILDMIVQDRLFLQRIGNYYNAQLIYIQAQQGTATNKLAASIRDLISSYYIYIKEKSKYYLMQSPNIQQPTQREQYLQGSNSLTILNEINICFKIQNLILDVNSKYRNRDKSLELVELVFNLLLKTYLFCHSIVAIALKIFVKRIPELSKYDLEYIRKFVNYYNTNYIQNFNNFILSNQYIKSYQLIEQQKQVVLDGQQFKQSQPDTNIQQVKIQNKVEGAVEPINNVETENREGSRRKVGKKLSIRQSQQKIIQIIDQQIKNVQMNSTPIPEVQKAPKIQSSAPSNRNIQNINQFRKSSSEDDEQKEMKLQEGQDYGELRVENKQTDKMDHKSSQSGGRSQEQLEEKLFELTKSMQYRNINFDSITNPKIHSIQDSGNKIKSSRSLTHQQGRARSSSTNSRKNQANNDVKMIDNQKQNEINSDRGPQTFDIEQAIDYADEFEIDQNYQNNKINKSIQQRSGDIIKNQMHNIKSDSKNDVNTNDIEPISHRANQSEQTLCSKYGIVDIKTDDKKISNQQSMQTNKILQKIDEIITTQQNNNQKQPNNTVNINNSVNENPVNTNNINKVENNTQIQRLIVKRKKSTIVNTDDKDVIEERQAKNVGKQLNASDKANVRPIDIEAPATQINSIRHNIETRESAPHDQISNGVIPILTKSKQAATQEYHSKPLITTQKVQQINAQPQTQKKQRETDKIKNQLKQDNFNQNLIELRNKQNIKVLDEPVLQHQQQLKTSLQFKVQERLNKQKQAEKTTQINTKNSGGEAQSNKIRREQSNKQAKQMDTVFDPINIEQQRFKPTIINNQANADLTQKSTQQQKRIQKAGKSTNQLRNQKTLQTTISEVQHKQKDEEEEIQVNQNRRLEEKIVKNVLNEQQIYFKQYQNCYSSDWEKSQYFQSVSEDNQQQTTNQFLNPLQIAQYFNRDAVQQPQQDEEQQDEAEQQEEQQGEEEQQEEEQHQQEQQQEQS